MTDQTIVPPAAQQEIPPQHPYGQCVGEGIAVDEYMEKYASQHYEWVRGYVIKMSPISLQHDDQTDYTRDLLKAYFSLNPIGRVIAAPFVMQVDATESRREPDLQVILKTNPGQLTDTAMIGPADICIEVVSAESVTRDYAEKFVEYEKGGVREYWIFDPLHSASHFYRLDESGVYIQQQLDADGNYRTPLLPKFALHVPTLWQEALPDFAAIWQTVQAMVK
jgi:Uma2 family endonuclease